MTIHMRPYAGAADLQRILDLKRTCTTPENKYDTPIFSELCAPRASPAGPGCGTASVGGRAGKSHWAPPPASIGPAGDHALGGER